MTVYIISLLALVENLLSPSEFASDSSFKLAGLFHSNTVYGNTYFSYSHNRFNAISTMNG